MNAPDHPAVLRAATPADAEQVAALWTEAYVTSGQIPGAPPFEASATAEMLGVMPARVAVLDERVVGAVVLGEHDAPGVLLTASDEEAILLRLAVAEDARRRGIARALVRWCADEARARGVRTLWLWTRPVQEQAHSLYESAGFVRRPDRDADAGAPERMVYALDLDKPR